MPSNIDKITQMYLAKGSSGDKTANPLIKLSFDEQIVADLIDCLQKPSPQITPEYVALVQRTASLLNVVNVSSAEIHRDTGARASWGDSSFPEQGTSGHMTKNMNRPLMIGTTADPQEKLRNEVNRLRNQVYDVINRVNDFVARAKNAGFVPPENPFVLAMSYNVGRIGYFPIKISSAIASKIVKNIVAYVALLDAERTGKLNLNNANSSAQLSSVKLSLDGFGGSGDALLDLSKLLPDADEVKTQKATEALSVFDFSKRIPKLLFTAHYAPDGIPKGIIVGWKKVPDASGYVIKRRNVFDGNEVTYGLTNSDVNASTARLSEYMKAWILTFYDNVNHSNVCCYLDADVSPHAYFFYKIQSYQLQNGSPGSMFKVETAPHFISQATKVQIRSQLELLDPNRDKLAKNAASNLRGLPPAQAGNPDLISPWPVLAHFILGDSKYDWLLAAINIRQSINRGDTRSTTRNYSYLAAQLNFLFAQADAGKLVVPKNKNMAELLNNVSDAISQFGTNQVIREVLQETGALYHFEGKDPNDNAMFTNVDASTLGDSGLIATVAAAIDPETATLNLRTLATNLPKLLSGEFVSINSSLADKVERNSSKTASTTEIEIPNFDKPSDTAAEDEIRFLRQMGDVGDGIVDLTTVDGIATFMRTVRIFSDIGPNRGAPVVNEVTPLFPDPVRPPPPAPRPPKSAGQPVEEPLTEIIETSGLPPTQAQRQAETADNRTDKNKSDAKDSLANDRTGRGRNGGNS